MTGLLLLVAIFWVNQTTDPATAPIVAIYYGEVGCPVAKWSGTSTLQFCGDNPCPCYDWSVVGFKDRSELLRWLRDQNKCLDSNHLRVFGTKQPTCRTVTERVEQPPVEVDRAVWEGE